MSDGRPNPLFETAEGMRLRDIETGIRWRKWGPYLAERQWGTVREDYSANGDAWRYLPHDHARSRAYRWGEDGIGGFCDETSKWCFGLGLWNGRDPFIKERLFGLSNGEGNHGEDVKEVYHYVDATPTHSYQKMVYRYPHAAFPYRALVDTNAARTRDEPEFELADTGIFAEGKFFDVTIEYAKAAPEDILMRVTVVNASMEPASLQVLPQLWARNTWSFGGPDERPRLRGEENGDVLAQAKDRTTRRLSVDGAATLLFCENETNTPLLYGGTATGPFKDGINDWLVHGRLDAVSAIAEGSKVAALHKLDLPAKGQATIRLRWRPDGTVPDPFADFDAIFDLRLREADEFYAVLQTGIADADARAVHRQALAGMLWSKQVYLFDIPVWLDGDACQPVPPRERLTGRNADWRHLNNADVISMPDTWEYPWYAAWDLAFHCITLALVDPAFAKAQLVLLTREWYMHPNGQLPAYEWSFGDVNPPVHAWAALRVYEMDRDLTGIADTAFLERILHKLMINFTWWVNRRDTGGRNLFQGGFLGLDNISAFNRSEALPGGATVDQADGTAWMAMYALNLTRMAIELAMINPVYEDIASKFFEHFLAIAGAMADVGGTGLGLWNDADGFFYDMVRMADGKTTPISVRSMVGLIPIFAVEVLDEDVLAKLPGFTARLHWFLKNRPKLAALVSRWSEPSNGGERYLLSLLRGHRLKTLLRMALDETEFLSDFGIRSMSKAHLASPFRLKTPHDEITVSYTPGEATSGLFGGNSNWRGPVWMPVNVLLIDSLRKFHSYFGPDFTVECPVGSGCMLNLDQVADELAQRLIRLFLRDRNGQRPALGGEVSDTGATVGDHLLFHEYFHGDTGKGLGASHQTGWTGLVANLIRGSFEPVTDG